MEVSFNFYRLKLRVVDYRSDSNEILYTLYNYAGAANLDYDVSYLVDNMIKGNPIEFSVGEALDENPDGIYPLIIKMTHLKLEATLNGASPTLYGEIVMVDNIAVQPIDQQGDVYDNILGFGFEVHDAYSVPVKVGAVDMMDAKD